MIWFFIPNPDPRCQIPDPGIEKAPDPGSLIRIRNTVCNINVQYRIVALVHCVQIFQALYKPVGIFTVQVKLFL
jgi:hypothetical protein